MSDTNNDLDYLFDTDSLLSALDEVQQEHEQEKLSPSTGIDMPGFSNLTKENKETPKEFENIDDIISDIDSLEEASEETVYVKSIDDYDPKIYCQLQLEEIAKGLDHRVDVSIYDSPMVSGRKMREIRYGLERGIDVSYYTNKNFSERQMREIRLGLQDGLDVETYARIILSPTDMKKKREELFHAKYGETQFPDLAYDFDDTDTNIHIYVEPGALEAGIIIKKQLPSTFTKFELEKLMKQYDITEGFIGKALPQNLANLPKNVKIPVMRGLAPVQGEDGYFEYKFNTNKDNKPVINEDGTVDYFTGNDFTRVNQGDLVMIYHGAKRGADGRTVTGISIKGEYGKELPVVENDSLFYNEETGEYTARKGGYVNYNDGEVTILDNLVIDREIRGVEDPITFDGTVIVNGSVKDNAQIYATGDIIINGFVEAARFNAGGSIIVSSGINGDENSCFVAKRDITAAFCENAFLDAGGNITIGYLLNSDVTSGGYIKTQGRKSLICGGNIFAKNGIETATIGSKAGAKTYVEIGNSSEEQEAYMTLESEKRQLESEMDKIHEAIEQMIAKMGANVARSSPSYERLQRIMSGYKEQLEETETKLEEYRAKLMEKSSYKIIATKEAYKNTTVSINGNKLLLQEDVKSPVFMSSGRKIVYGDKDGGQ